MASTMVEILGDMLVTQPVDRNENKMPSPEQLMYKFIIKHKRLPEKVNGDQAVTIRHNDDCKTIIFNLYLLYLMFNIFVYLHNFFFQLKTLI